MTPELTRSLAAAVLATAALASGGCADAPVDVDAEKIALLEIHLADIRAHRERDVDGLLRTIGPDLRLVADGEITIATREEIAAHFGAYFAGAEYPVYEDLEVPHAEVSDDGTMGWVVSRLHVERLEPDGEGGRRVREFTYAGLTAYRKVDGRWQKTANVSTFAPPD